MKTKAVKVKANTVSIVANKNNQVTNKEKRKRRRRKKTKNAEIVEMPIVKGASSNIVMPVFLKNNPNLSEAGKEWLEAYMSPCTETGLSPSAMTIPDAAVPYSASPYQRADLTIHFPFQNESQTDLTGRNYSMLVLMIPNFRNSVVVLGNKNGSEFTPAIINDLLHILNTLDVDAALYPEFVTGLLTSPDQSGEQTPDNYVTVIQSTALATIPLPDSEGVSPVISQLRCVFNGLTIGHNTPDLFNQATCSGMVIANRVSTTDESQLESSTQINLRIYANFNRLTGAHQVGYQVIAFSNPEVLATTPFITFSPSATFTATHIVRNLDGSILLNVSDQYRYEASVIATGEAISLVNITTSQSVVLTTYISNFTSINSKVLSFDHNSDDSREGVLKSQFNLITLPPVQQSDISQTVPGSSIFLMKDGGGCYMPTFKFTPVFTPSAVNFIRQRFVQFSPSNIEPIELTVQQGGIIDHMDNNFGMGIINIQSMPYAAQPYFKLRRTHQVVPASGSFFGLFAYNNTAHDQLAIDIADKLHETQVHLHPATANFLDTLVRVVGKVVNNLPKYMNSAVNVANAVTAACDQVGNGVTRRNLNNVITRGRRHF